MAVRQGDLSLLQHPVSQELLQSKIPARLAYVWMDGTPRVVPIWFHWNGAQFIMATSPKAPKVRALRANPRVALTIDTVTFPPNVLMVRGTASIEIVDGVPSEYLEASKKVVAADQHDSQVGYQLLSQLQQRPYLLPCVRRIFADGGFRGNLEEWVKQALHIQLDIVLKEEGKPGFQVLPKRWVIERTNAWVTRNRRMARDYELLLQRLWEERFGDPDQAPATAK